MGGWLLPTHVKGRKAVLYATLKVNNSKVATPKLNPDIKIAISIPGELIFLVCHNSA